METPVLEPPVAKPKAKKTAPAPEPAEEPKTVNRKPMIVQVRGTAEYKAWAERIADKEGDTLAKLFDRALRDFARGKGYGDPPKR